MIPGAGVDRTINSVGHVCLLDSKTDRKKVYMEMQALLFDPFIEKIRKEFYSKAKKMPVFYKSIDGEKCQVDGEIVRRKQGLFEKQDRMRQIVPKHLGHTSYGTTQPRSLSSKLPLSGHLKKDRLRKATQQR